MSGAAGFLQKQAHLQDERITLRRLPADPDGSAFFVPDNLEFPGSDLVLTMDPGELYVRSIFRKVLRNGTACAKAPQHVLDIGANEGYFGLLSAHWGCNVTWFEPQPGCVALLQAATLMNGWGSNTARVIPKPVSDKPVQMLVHQSSKCSREFSGLDAQHMSLKRVAKQVRKVTVKDSVATINSVSLQTLFSTADVFALIKIYVAGAEISVLNDLLPFVQRRQVQNIVVQMTPDWWTDSKRRVVDILTALEQHNLSAFAQSAPRRKLRATEIVQFIKTRSPRQQENIWYRLDEVGWDRMYWSSERRSTPVDAAARPTSGSSRTPVRPFNDASASGLDEIGWDGIHWSSERHTQYVDAAVRPTSGSSRTPVRPAAFNDAAASDTNRSALGRVLFMNWTLPQEDLDACGAEHVLRKRLAETARRLHAATSTRASMRLTVVKPTCQVRRIEPAELTRWLLRRGTMISRSGNVELIGVTALRRQCSAKSCELHSKQLKRALGNNAGVYVKPGADWHAAFRSFYWEYGQALMAADWEMVVQDQCYELVPSNRLSTSHSNRCV